MPYLPMLYLVVPFAVWGLCALSDLTSFTIPNRYVAVLLVAWPVAMLLTGASWPVVAGSLAVGGVFLLAGFALFAAGLLGAGDAKLIAASALWIGPSAALPFVLYTTLIGAGLGIALLRLRALPLPAFACAWPWAVRLHERRRVMPYGVAIALGGMIALPSGVVASSVLAAGVLSGGL